MDFFVPMTLETACEYGCFSSVEDVRYYLLKLRYSQLQQKLDNYWDETDFLQKRLDSKGRKRESWLFRLGDLANRLIPTTHKELEQLARWIF